VRSDGAVADLFMSNASTPKNILRTRYYLTNVLEQPHFTVRLLTPVERKLIEKLQVEKSWDPDVRALCAILENLEPRWTEAMNTINVLDETDKLLKNAHISNVVYDVFDSGKVGVCRRTGLFGVGMSLREAFKHVQVVDDKALRTVERGNLPDE
jgi:Cdc6-like AAA superfamily ATPase